MNERLFDEGFSLGEIHVFPLDSKIVGPRGERALSPIAMELLCQMAYSRGGKVPKAHLILQTWGSATPDKGTLSHYIAELNHKLERGRNLEPLIDHEDGERYWLTEKPKLLAAGDKPKHLNVQPGSQTEIKGGKITQTAILYLVASWFIIQIADATFPALGLGDNVIRLIIFTIVAGLPITLLISWLYDRKRAKNPEKFNSDSSRVAYVLAGSFIAVPLALGFQWFLDGEILHEERAPQEIEQLEVASNSIAVLAFQDFSSEAGYDYLGDGIAEELLNSLSKTGQMLVAPRVTSFNFKGDESSVVQIGNRLGVRYILEGSVRRIADRLRVIVRLNDTSSGFLVWSNSYDEAITEIFDVQQDISQQVVRSLNIVLSASKSEQLGAAPTNSVQAYDYYLQGRNYLNKPSTKSTLDNAIEFFSKAVQIDPNYADAFAGLCESYLGQYIETNTSEWFGKAENACRETLRFDVVTGEVRIALGNLYRESGRYQRAQEQLEVALAKHPNSVDALSALAKNYAKTNNMEEAERLFRKAIEVQPRNWRGPDELGNFLVQSGRSEEAISAYRRTIELTSENPAAYNNLGAALLMNNQFEEAAAAWEKSLSIELTESASSNAGSSHFLAGRFDDAARMYQKATELAPDKFELWGNLADAQRLGSSSENAATSYQRAIVLAQRSLEINPRDQRTMAILSHYYSHSDDLDAAATLVNAAIEDDPNDIYVWYYAALTWLTLDNNAMSAQALQRAIDLGYPVSMILADQELKALTSITKYRQQLALE